MIMMIIMMIIIIITIILIGKSWTFPRGKVNENESELACACREVYEETGRDIVWSVS